MIHNANAHWVHDVKRNYKNNDEQQDITINLRCVQKQLKKMAKWKASGPDHVHEYWIKGFTNLHGLIAEQLNEQIKLREVIAWIDYKKAFDMIHHSWILECLDIFKVAKNLTRLIQNSMKHWKVELTAGGEKLGEVNIKRGIFQGDSLCPLLFVLALIPSSTILKKIKEKNINHLLFLDDLKL